MHTAGRLTALIQAFNAVEHSIVSDWKGVDDSGSQTLLSALHTVYEQPATSQEISTSLAKLDQLLDPNEGLLTFNKNKRGAALAIAPFLGSGKELPQEMKLPNRC